MAVLAKGQDGTVTVKRESDQGPLGLAVGAMVGGLVGLLGGPAGVAIGMGGGALLGSFNDLANLGVNSAFLEDISKDLTPGSVALVAEVSEEWVTPLNARMLALGGILHRTGRATVEDELSQKEMASAKAELSQLKSEYEHVKDESKASLKSRIEEVEPRPTSLRNVCVPAVSALKQETEAKLKALQTQASKLSGDLKVKIENRISELHVDQERRSHQLQQAWGLTKKRSLPNATSNE